MAGFAVPVLRTFYLGQVASGALIYVYQTGTTTPITTYSDGGLTTPNTNPIVSDTNGEALFYVATSHALRLDIKTSGGTLIRSIDPVQVVPDLSDFSDDGIGLSYVTDISPGQSQASKALVTDSNNRVSNIALLTSNTASSGIASMASVQNSMTGGYVNKFRNAGMDICSRAPSGTVTAGSPAYTLDGWIVGSTGANVAWAQLKAGFSLPTSATASALALSTATGMTDLFFKQRIEGLIAAGLAGQQVTVQAIIYHNIGSSITPTLTVKHATALDNWASTATDVNAVSLQSVPNITNTVVSYVFACPASASNGLEVTIDFGNAANVASKTIYATYLDIRATPGAPTGLPDGITQRTPTPEIRPPSIETILNARYLPSFGDLAGIIGSGSATSATAFGMCFQFHTPTRVAPTGLTITTVGNISIYAFNGGAINPMTGLTFSNASNHAAFATGTVASGMTAATPYFANVITPLAGNLIFTGAEL